jgi:indolepyruvate ferredoxin oxidoreductase alpha subunit
MLKRAILGEKGSIRVTADVPNRPPILCPGCPHRSVYTVLKKLKIRAAGDIGCYTLGAVAPLSIVDTTICMGASISSLHGMEKAKGKEYIKDWVAVIGDSTFLHTGVNSLINMVYNKGTGTVMILDNSTTGMTGHQDHSATGKTLMGEATYSIDLEELCKAVGVSNVYTINAFDTKKLEKTIKEAVMIDEVVVIIANAPCALLDKSAITKQYSIDQEKCKKCGLCMKPGCPAITKMENGDIIISDTMCNGCGLCVDLCRFDAIKSTKPLSGSKS